MCDRWSKTPDEIWAMSAGALRMLKILKLGKLDEEREGGVNYAE